jgi:Lrp/AsnC family leucine-responsive transcriptional regulator
MLKPEFDPTDLRILQSVQEDGRLSNVELADRVHLSPSPCLRRLRLLEERGVIKSYAAHLDRTKIGLGLTVFVALKVEPSETVDVDTIAEALRSLKGLISAHLISGQSDYIIQLAVPDLQQYERLLLENLLKLPGVRDIQSSFVIRTIAENEPLQLDHLEE